MKKGMTCIICRKSVLSQSEAISGSLEARASTLPYPYAGNDAPDASADTDDQTRLVCFSGQAILSQIKLMTDLSKRIEKKIRSLARCLVAGSTAEGCATPVHEGMAGSWPDDHSESGYATPVEEFSDTFLDPTTESVSERTVEARTSTSQEKAASGDPLPWASMSFESALARMKTRNSEINASVTAVESRTSMLPEKEASMSCEAAVAQMKARNLSLLRSPDVQRPPTGEFVGSNSQIYSNGESSLDKCSAGGGKDSRKYIRRYPGRYAISGSVDLQRHSTCTTSKNSRRNSSFTVQDLPRYESTGGKLDSLRSSIQARHSSFTVSDLPWYESTGGRSSTQGRHSSFAVSDLPRYERSSTPPADSWRSSTHASTTDARRYSTGAREVPVPTSSKKSSLLSPVHCVRSLLNPATSMETFLSLVCTEETLVSTYDSSTQKSKRSSSETLVRIYDSRVLPGTQKSSEILPRRGLSTKTVMTSTENLDWSMIRTVPERQDSYSNSNISWSKPLEDERSLKVEPPKKEEPRSNPLDEEPSLEVKSPEEEEPRPSTPEPSPSADHLAIYVGSERKKLFISSQVFNHELFKQLLNSHHYKVEKRDGNSAIVLTCDIDYFRRLLFFVDKRPQGIR